MTGPSPDRSPALAEDHADLLASVISDRTVRSVFQPIVDLESEAVVAFEALARGPEGPLATPDVLFSTARRAGLLRELDELCRASAFLGASAVGLVAPLTLFVNVEPEVLSSAPIEELLALAESVPGELRVVMEFTERALTSRPAELLRTADRVRELGWGVALDDVGADPASLAFMALLRPDVVKLDLSLVQQQATPAIAEIMSAVNAYAERTGALVLAEGIETPRHLMLARALGASLGQGWLFGRPTAEPALQPVARPLRLLEPQPPLSADRLASPFACLSERTPLRRSPKPLLVEVSKQLEQEAMRLGEACVVASSFQYEWHFTTATAKRYQRLAQSAGFVCAMGQGLTGELAPGVRSASLDPQDPMLGEWDVIVLSPHFSAALLANDLGDDGPEHERMFEYALTYERETVVAAAHRMLARIAGLA
jgi:EAL domain-containing protein (putative c-di-GMP-specific phosphodiesterase class I)